MSELALIIQLSHVSHIFFSEENLCEHNDSVTMGTKVKGERLKTVG